MLSKAHSLKHLNALYVVFSLSYSNVPTLSVSTVVPAQSSAPVVSKERPIWRKPSMDALIAYMSNMDMMLRRGNPGTIARMNAIDVDQEMADYVNKVCNFSPTDQNYWTAKKTNKYYGCARTLYDQANALWTSTGSGNTSQSTLKTEMLALCPKFDDFHRIFSAQFTRDRSPSPSCCTGSNSSLQSGDGRSCCGK